jgi:hypothetical protein
MIYVPYVSVNSLVQVINVPFSSDLCSLDMLRTMMLVEHHLLHAHTVTIMVNSLLIYVSDVAVNCLQCVSKVLRKWKMPRTHP